MADEKRWTVQKTATISFLVGAVIWAVGAFLEPTKSAAFASAGFWALKYLVPTITTILISFFFLGRQRPDKFGALKGAALGAMVGPVVGWVLSLVLIFVPVVGWALLPLCPLLGRVLSSYLSAAGTVLGELKEEK